MPSSPCSPPDEPHARNLSFSSCFCLFAVVLCTQEWKELTFEAHPEAAASLLSAPQQTHNNQRSSPDDASTINVDQRGGGDEKVNTEQGEEKEVRKEANKEVGKEEKKEIGEGKEEVKVKEREETKEEMETRLRMKAEKRRRRGVFMPGEEEMESAYLRTTSARQVCEFMGVVPSPVKSG